FRRHNDSDVSPDDLPSETYYITLERDADQVREKMETVLNSHRYDTLVENTTFVDFSDDYLEAMPILSNTKSGSWDGGEYRNLLRKLRKYLDENADDAVVVIDSITSLFKATEFGLGRANVLSFLTYLTDASRDWDGLVYGLNYDKASTVRNDGVLASTPDGVLYFKIGQLGGGLHRAMYMGSFHGTFSHSQDTIRVYQVHIGARGFEVSTVNEII
ncbi:MAG: hypothetical protein SXQ77_01890, partial [Halobacteria archaeon]|nr:hypothetical protein [Halobacteria archaeon]